MATQTILLALSMVPEVITEVGVAGVQRINARWSAAQYVDQQNPNDWATGEQFINISTVNPQYNDEPIVARWLEVEANFPDLTDNGEPSL